MKNIITKENEKYLLFAITIFFYYTYTSPIINADRFYIDDLGRSIIGYTNWSINGRPLADAIMLLLSFGYPLVDISPIPLVIGLVILSLSFVFFVEKNMKNDDFFIKCLLPIVFICNPFLLENLSYKFDSLPMLLSISFLIISYSFSNSILRIILPIVFVISSLSLYQASISLFVCFAAFEFLLALKNQYVSPSQGLYLILLRAMQLIVGYIIYTTFIADYFINEGYNKLHSENVKLSSDGFFQIIKNVDSFHRLIQEYTGFFGLTLLTSLVLILFISASKSSFDILKKRKTKSTYSYYILSLVSIAAFYIFSFLHLSILKSPVIAPRVLISFGFFLFFCAYVISQVNIFKPIIVLFVFFSLVFSFTYGNALKAQKDHDEFIASMLASDIYKVGVKYKSISIAGTMPSSRQVSLAQSKLPLLNKLIPIYLNNDWGWGPMLLEHYGINAEIREKLTQSDRSLICTKAPLIDNKMYSIFVEKDKLLIKFTGYKC